MGMSCTELWNHNNHYHEMLLGHVGAGWERILDVGCGHGFFAARLAEAADHVDALDLDSDVVIEASRLHPSSRINFRQGNFLVADLPSEHYDVVTAIAAIHHMDLATAFGQVNRVLRPGGRLVALGLYRETSLLDYAVAGLAIPADRLRRARGPARGNGREMTAPICEPGPSLREIRAVASSLLPGAVVSRHLYWRYSLVWRKPLAGARVCAVALTSAST